MNDALTIGYWIGWLLMTFGWWAIGGGTIKETTLDVIHATIIIGFLWIGHKIYCPRMKPD